MLRSEEVLSEYTPMGRKCHRMYENTQWRLLEQWDREEKKENRSLSF